MNENMILDNMVKASDLRSRVDEIRDTIVALRDDIDELISDYVSICNADTDFEDREFSDYAGWVVDFEDLMEYIKVKNLDL